MHSQTPNTVRPNQWQHFLSTSPPDYISIATFNTLRRNYDFGKKYYINEFQRQWSTRHELHKSLFASLATDIICLQEAEVSSFEEDFGFTKQLGYSAIAPVAKQGEHEHTKPSILFKKDRFILRWQNSRSRTLIAQFEDQVTSKLFYLINCHLQGGKGQEDQRCFQARSALQQVILHLKKNNKNASEKDVVCFLSGDFNEPLGFPLHTLIKEGRVTNEEIATYFHGKSLAFTHNFGFQDSFGSLPERPFTFKWGVKDDAVFQAIDFIYFSDSKVDVVNLRLPLNEDQEQPMRETLGIPNSWHPSDHLPSAALFKFK